MRISSTKHKRKLLVGGVAAVATTALLIPTLPALAADSASEEWEHVELPLPDGMWRGIVTSVDSTGDFAGGSSGPNHTDPEDDHRFPMATVWADTEPTIVPMPDNETQSIVLDVNDAGTGVGKFYIEGEDTGSTAFGFIDGETVELPLPDGLSGGAEATGVNNDGTIVGTLNSDSDSKGPSSQDVALRWSADGSDVTVLDLPEGADGSGATDIDDAGTIAGFAYTDKSVPVLWNAEGEPTLLPDGQDDDTIAEQVEGNWTKGITMIPGPSLTRWSDDAGEMEVTQLMRRGDIAANGDVAGTRLADSERFEEAVLLDEAGDLTALPMPGNSSTAWAITPDSTVVGGHVTGPENLDHHLPSLWVHQG